MALYYMVLHVHSVYMYLSHGSNGMLCVLEQRQSRSQPESRVGGVCCHGNGQYSHVHKVVVGIGRATGGLAEQSSHLKEKALNGQRYRTAPNFRGA